MRFLQVEPGLDTNVLVRYIMQDDLLLRSKEIRLDRADQVLQAQRKFKTGRADFADCLIERIAHDVGCASIMTFDVAAVKSAGMTLINRG